MAGRQGFEPRYADPESAVLPLDDLPVGQSYRLKRVGGCLSRSLISGRRVRFALVPPRRGYLEIPSGWQVNLKLVQITIRTPGGVRTAASPSALRKGSAFPLREASPIRHSRRLPGFLGAAAQMRRIFMFRAGKAEPFRGAGGKAPLNREPCIGQDAQNNRKLTSTVTCTGTGVPFRMAGLNFHVFTVSTAFSSNPSPSGLMTRHSVTLPEASTTINSTTVP